MLLASERAIAGVVWKRTASRWSFGALAAMSGVLLLITTMEGPDPLLQAKENRDLAVAFLGLVTMLLSVLIAATELPRDINTQVMPLVLAKPLARHQVVLGKLFGVLLFVGAFFLVGILVTTIALWGQGLAPDGVFLRLVLATALRMGLFVCAAVLFSTALNEMPCILFTTIYIALGYGVVILDPLLRALPGPDWVKGPVTAVLYGVPNMSELRPPRTWLSDWFLGLITPASAAHARETRFALDAVFAGGGVPTWGDFGAQMLYAILYAALLVVVAILWFRQRPVC